MRLTLPTTKLGGIWVDVLDRLQNIAQHVYPPTHPRDLHPLSLLLYLAWFCTCLCWEPMRRARLQAFLSPMIWRGEQHHCLMAPHLLC